MELNYLFNKVDLEKKSNDMVFSFSFSLNKFSLIALVVTSGDSHF